MRQNNLLRLLSKLQLVKVTKWADDSQINFAEFEERHDVTDLMDANVVTSRRTGFRGHHAVLLDLDVQAHLVPSSTPGHSHLYIAAAVPEKDYFDLLDQLAKCGIIERGYAEASKAKGGTCLRLPWVKKAPLPANEPCNLYPVIEGSFT